MTSRTIEILRAGPLATVQDEGRPGHFADGISASGPMDRAGFFRAGSLLDAAGESGIEFTMAGLSFRLEGGPVEAAFSGGMFSLHVDNREQGWDRSVQIQPGTVVDIRPGPEGNYGYVRFAGQVDVPPVLGSRATNLVVGLGGFAGRALKAGDRLGIAPVPPEARTGDFAPPPHRPEENAPFRFIWGVHAEQFSSATRQAFCDSGFTVSTRLDRMGVRLDGAANLFANERILSLVSEPVVPGDIQILGDGTPIVLMRDHQPTGGYPRIGTVISTDLDRFAQMRPGREIRFSPVSIAHAQRLLQTG